MKNLANCTPSEFIKQTARLKDAVADLNSKVKFDEIRNKAPAYRETPITATVEERKKIIEENAMLLREQATKNIMEMLDLMLNTYPMETLNVLALSCFVEPENVDDHSMDEYLGCVMDILESKNVMRFFTFLVSTKKPQLDT